MINELLDHYTLYKLHKIKDCKSYYDRQYKCQKQVAGKYELSFMGEALSSEELYEQYPICEVCYSEETYPIANPIDIDEKYFYSFSFSKNIRNYAWAEEFISTNYVRQTLYDVVAIYRDYNWDLLILVNAFGFSQIKEMELSLQDAPNRNYPMKQYRYRVVKK